MTIRPQPLMRTLAGLHRGHAGRIDLALVDKGVAAYLLRRQLSEAAGVPLYEPLGRGIRLTDAEDGIPTLPQVLDMIGGAVPLLIEIKDQTLVPGGTIGPLEAHRWCCRGPVRRRACHALLCGAGRARRRATWPARPPRTSERRWPSALLALPHSLPDPPLPEPSARQEPRHHQILASPSSPSGYSHRLRLRP